MRPETFYAAMHYHHEEDERRDGLRLCLYLAGGHKLTGTPHITTGGMLSLTPTSDSGRADEDHDGDAIILDIADIVAVRAFVI